MRNSLTILRPSASGTSIVLCTVHTGYRRSVHIEQAPAESELAIFERVHHRLGRSDVMISAYLYRSYTCSLPRARHARVLDE